MRIAIPKLITQFNIKTTTKISSYTFAQIQAKKVVDKTKASIRLMTTYREVKNQPQLLKQTYQLHRNLVMGSYFRQVERNKLGQLAFYIYQSQMIVFQQENGFNKFLNTLLNCAKRNQFPMLAQHKLDSTLNMRNFLNVLQHLSLHTSDNFNMFCLAFLSQCIDHQLSMSDQNFYQISKYLTKRGFMSKTVQRHFQTYYFDKNQALHIFQQGNTNQILTYFQKFSNILQSILNLQIKDKNDHIKQNPIKHQLIQFYFSILQNPAILEILLQVWDPQLLLIDQIFKTHKNRYLSIMKQIFSPIQFCSIKTNPKCLTLFLNKLYLYCTYQDKQHIHSILNNYTKCLKSINNDGFDQKILFPSIILLCDKYNYYSQVLYSIIAITYSNTGLDTQQHYIQSTVKTFQKNKINLKNVGLYKATMNTILLKNMNTKNNKLSQLLLENIVRNLQYLIQNNKFDNNLIQHYLLNVSKIQDKQRKIQDKQNFHYLFTDYHFISEFKDKYFKEYVSKTKSQLKIKIDPEKMESLVTLRFSQGARLKAFLQNIYYIRFFIKNQVKNQEIYQVLADHKKLFQIVQKNIAYPGLLQIIYKLYHSAKLGKNNIHTQNSQLQRFVQRNQNNANILYQQLIKQIKQNPSQKLLAPQLYNRIQLLTHPIKKNHNFYANIQNLKQINNFQFNDRLIKYQTLVNKITEQLNVLKNRFQIFAIPFFAQFPFIADYFISFNQKNYVIIFVDQINKQKYEQSVEKPIGKKIQSFQKQNQKNNQTANNQQIMVQQELCIKFFQKSYTVILMSGVDDVKILRTIAEKGK